MGLVYSAIRSRYRDAQMDCYSLQISELDERSVPVPNVWNCGGLLIATAQRNINAIGLETMQETLAAYEIDLASLQTRQAAEIREYDAYETAMVEKCVAYHRKNSTRSANENITAWSQTTQFAKTIRRYKELAAQKNLTELEITELEDAMATLNTNIATFTHMDKRIGMSASGVKTNKKLMTKHVENMMGVIKEQRNKISSREPLDRTQHTLDTIMDSTANAVADKLADAGTGMSEVAVDDDMRRFMAKVSIAMSAGAGKKKNTSTNTAVNRPRAVIVESDEEEDNEANHLFNT